MIDKRILFMNILALFNFRKYIRYLCLSVVMASYFCGETQGYELLTKGLSLFEADKCPYEKQPGFIAGGLEFDYVVVDENGKEYSMADFKEKVVIMLFTTTWCPNCPASQQMLDSLIKKLKKDNVENVEVISLNIGNDSLRDLKEHYQEYGIKNLRLYKSVSPRNVKNIRSVPTCVIFDKKGKSRCAYVGGKFDYCAKEFIEFIMRLSKEG